MRHDEQLALIQRALSLIHADVEAEIGCA